MKLSYLIIEKKNTIDKIYWENSARTSKNAQNPDFHFHN